MKFRQLITLSIILIFVLSACSKQYPQEKVSEFAQCLTENGVVMYGAYWCPHCSKSKAKFGQAFKEINYVECDPKCDPVEGKELGTFCKGYEGQSLLCIERDILKFDTWEFSDGTRLISEPSFEELSEKSGCPWNPDEVV